MKTILYNFKCQYLFSYVKAKKVEAIDGFDKTPFLFLSKQTEFRKCGPVYIKWKLILVQMFHYSTNIFLVYSKPVFTVLGVVLST